LLSSDKIKFLLALGDGNINRLIIREALPGCNLLPYSCVESIYPRLAELAGTDNETIQDIFSFQKKHKRGGYWSQNVGSVVIVAIILLLLIAYMRNDSSPTSTDSYSQSDGDLDNTFADDKVMPAPTASPSQPISNYLPELTIEQKLQQEKDKLLEEGWEEKELKNGQLATCYNFTPKKSKINNYLEVQVGTGSTDNVLSPQLTQASLC
jgi:hypothetical protein